MKRICLFAGYDAKGIIHDYVIYYLTKLSKIADVYYLSDNNMTEDELAKLDGITKQAFSIKHHKYDFGSYQALINILGWDEIEKYDQLMLVNDSSYGPLFDLQPIFDACELKYDYWGITETHMISYHIQSFFVVINNKIIKNSWFRMFIDKIQKEKSFNEIVLNYEIGLSQLIADRGFKIGAYAKNSTVTDPTKYPLMLVNKFHVPFIKIKILTGAMQSMNSYSAILHKIERDTDYPSEFIEKHILTKNNSLLKNKVKVFIQFLSGRASVYVPSWLLVFKITGKGKLLIKIIKIPVLNLKIKW